MTESPKHPPNSFQSFMGCLIVVGLVILLAGVVRSIADAEMFQPAPAGPYRLAELEERVDKNAAAVLQEVGDRPVLVDAVVSSSHSDRVTLESIGMLDVQAYTSSSGLTFAEGQAVRLRCRTLSLQDYPLGKKPAFEGCRPA